MLINYLYHFIVHLYTFFVWFAACKVTKLEFEDFFTLIQFGALRTSLLIHISRLGWDQFRTCTRMFQAKHLVKGKLYYFVCYGLNKWNLIQKLPFQSVLSEYFLITWTPVRQWLIHRQLLFCGIHNQKVSLNEQKLSTFKLF